MVKAMHVKLNTETPLCNHSYSEKAMSVTYTEYVFLALGIQHAMRMRRVVICGLPRSTILFHITYSECVFVALGIQYAMRMRRVFVVYVGTGAGLPPIFFSTNTTGKGLCSVSQGSIKLPPIRSLI